MTVACLQLASVFLVIGRWSMDLDVIFIISGVRCIVMIGDEYIESFHKKTFPLKQSTQTKQEILIFAARAKGK